MYATRYTRAISVDEALEQIAAAEDGAFLAGGHTLLPTMKQRLAAPDVLIDIARIADLNFIEISDEDVVIGAATPHAVVAASAELAAVLPALPHLASLIGDPMVRSRGTIGGSVANNDPAADYPAAILGLNAKVITSQRSIPADDFFAGLFETVLESGELITHIRFPRPSRAAYRKLRSPASRYAVAGVMVSLWPGGSVRVAVTGAGSDGVFRWTEAEDRLTQTFNADAIRALRLDPADMQSDFQCSAPYRAGVAGHLLADAVTEALSAGPAAASGRH
ncbi:MAG: xanthine dehydrogenase family protein subunit M [Pseudomonadota bacterium]|nr:xanthine dehydrogenase family protein subunit M [Pseudomonadota bacterium]